MNTEDWTKDCASSHLISTHLMSWSERGTAAANCYALRRLKQLVIPVLEHHVVAALVALLRESRSYHELLPADERLDLAAVCFPVHVQALELLHARVLDNLPDDLHEDIEGLPSVSARTILAHALDALVHDLRCVRRRHRGSWRLRRGRGPRLRLRLVAFRIVLDARRLVAFDAQAAAELAVVRHAFALVSLELCQDPLTLDACFGLLLLDFLGLAYPRHPLHFLPPHQRLLSLLPAGGFA
eukprot:scaffold991_cov227-Pinguiococcus_pyrenoidosus.AAC.6